MEFIGPWLRHHYDITIKDNVHDDEVDSWFLMNSPWPIFTVIILYLLFVLKAGPRIMKNRKPFSLKSILLIYNLAVAIFNGYIFSTYFKVINLPLKYLCVPHPSRNSLFVTNVMYKTCWYYLLSKIVELLDTVFFVLRKKQSQVSVLHVYHHTCMVLNTWLYLKYLKSEQGIVVGTLNTFVHIIMYFYYFLAALGPKMQKYLWWKKYITMLQIMQFAIILTYLAVLLLMNCKVHRALSIYMVVHTIIFILMFTNFYKKEYFKKKSKIY